MEETDADVEVEVKTDEGATLVEEARTLQKRLKETFGGSALTSRIEDEGASVIVNGDGWQFTARGGGDGELVFKPGDTAYRIVRPVGTLNRVERDGEAIVFVFDDGESFTLKKGMEHRV